VVIVREGVAVLICVLVALGAWVPVAGAEEAKTPISASMILSIFAQPVTPRVSAFDRALKEDGPPRRAADCEAQPDGSVRCGAGAGSVGAPPAELVPFQLTSPGTSSPA